MRGLSDGIGVWCGSEGSVYAGEWSSGQKDRLGKQEWARDGRVYVGTWRLGVRAGLGVETTRGEWCVHVCVCVCVCCVVCVVFVACVF